MSQVYKEYYCFTKIEITCGDFENVLEFNRWKQAQPPAENTL